MKPQQHSPDMLKKMADSMNLSEPEFEEMMREEHGLLPPDELDDDEEYYEPPERLMREAAIKPADASDDADRLRKKLLNPDLSRYEREEIANDIALRVSISDLKNSAH